MATFAVGDIQGCYEPFAKLLDKIKFDDKKDKLWLTGDLVNRGPDSLKVLRFVKQLGSCAISVLGNHDLSLLALNAGAIKPSPKDTFDSVLKAKDREELIHWLKSLPILHYQQEKNTVLVHAGVYPLWTLNQAIKLAKELEHVLRSPQCDDFLNHMFGATPDRWDDNLSGFDRLRFITNAFTRMRFYSPEGRLPIAVKLPPNQAPPGTMPWFSCPNPAWEGTKIIFGHWAALEGKCEVPGINALDTGCVWGKSLTAMSLETGQRFHIDCHE